MQDGRDAWTAYKNLPSITS